MFPFSPISPVKRWLLLVFAAMTALLSACGGGGGSGSSPGAGTSLTAVYFTDDFSAEYDAVWISVSRVTAVSPSGETQLAQFEPAQLVNLPTLRRTGALMATAQVPRDATAVRVYVGGSAQLQQLDGSMLTASLAAPGGYLEFRLEGWNTASGALALDFDLPRFTLQNGVLTAATRIASKDDYAGWNQRYAESEGTVTAASATSLTVDTRHHGQRSFVIDANTTFVSARSATWTPAVGDRVEITSLVSGQGTELQFTARTVKDETDSESQLADKVEGVVTALSTLDGVTRVTANIRRSKMAGVQGEIAFDVNAATRFKRGSADLLAVGVEVEAYLVPQGSGWVAAAVEIEGAARTGPSAPPSVSQGFVELKGRVTSVSGTALTLQATHTERLPGVAVGESVTLDIANAYFERGSVACLVAGSAVEVKGYLDAAGLLQPVRLEVEGACSSAYPTTGVSPPTSPPSSGAAVFAEVKGTVTAVRSGEFDLDVFRIESSGGGSPTSVTVVHGPATIFREVNPDTLAAGNFLEIKGSLLGTVLTASKIERE